MASPNVLEIHSKLARFPQHTKQRHVPRVAVNSCVGCALHKDNQTKVGGIQPVPLMLSCAPVLYRIFPEEGMPFSSSDKGIVWASITPCASDTRRVGVSG